MIGAVAQAVVMVLVVCDGVGVYETLIFCNAAYNWANHLSLSCYSEAELFTFFDRSSWSSKTSSERV